VSALAWTPSGRRALSASEARQTAESIAEVQLPNGMIPWFPGGHADPWNHVEAAMGMALAGLRREAEAAYEWLVASQHRDGSWCMYYLTSGVESPRRDTNVCAYVATGVWHHFLLTQDRGFLESMWPTVEAAIGFVLRHQRPGGDVAWCVEPDGSLGRFSLLTGSSSVYFSLRCAIACGEMLGRERPDWELAAGRLAHAIAFNPEQFEPKHRWAMDWYYPILCGALRGLEGEARIESRWDEFVMEGLGVRCVSDRQWVTAAETAECVMALDALGRSEQARTLFSWAQSLRHPDGSYWTGWVHPQRAHFPGGERTTYTAGAVLLAADTLDGSSPASGLFRGDGLPQGLDLLQPVVDPAEDPQAPAAPALLDEGA
jgi:hypothetical protein